jgi:uncharacterized protein
MGEGCVIVRVRLTPKSSLDGIDGIEATMDGPALKARVRAVPSEGQANTALIKLLVEWLGVPKSSVSLTGGGKSRVKSVAVSGDRSTIEARLSERTARFQKND